MKPLRTRFRSGCFEFKQIAREGRIAVYELRNGEHHTWEVIKIGFRGGRLLKGKALEACEVYPSSESWGVKGWACTTKERAFQKMDELLKEREAK